MCNQRHSESGACTHINKCYEYAKLEKEIKSLRSILDKARAVSASWEQWMNTEDPDALDAMYEYVSEGMKRLIVSLDGYDTQKGE